MATRTMQQGTPIVWRNSGGDYAITLASLADEASREAVKGDLSKNSQFAKDWLVQFLIETGGTAPTAGEVIYLYWSASDSATAAIRNAGGASGTDGIYKTGQEAEWIKQLKFIGALILTNDASTIQQMSFPFRPPSRYGMPIVWNKSGQTLETNDDEHQIRFIPILDVIE